MMHSSLAWAALVDPRKMFSLALAFITSPSSTISPEASFYPPLDSVSYISDKSYGAFGGIFTAPSDDESLQSDGTYNYCTMPHPDADHYQPPMAILNGSAQAQLVYLEYMQRHQRRTPYNILPEGEGQTYNCDNVRVYSFTGPTDENSLQMPQSVFGQTYSDPSNPFLAHYVNSTCQFPQLTIGGFLDGYRHGRDLWAVYGDKLGLLPPSPKSGSVWFRSSDSPLTKASAGAVLRGVWPEYDGPLPLHQQAPGVDTINQGLPCEARDRLLSQIQSTDEWEAHLSVTEPLRTRLANLFGGDHSKWMDTFDHFADNFQARLCNGYRLPCSTSDDSKCVSEDDAFAVFRGGDWEWNYWWRRNPTAVQYIQLTEGLFIKEIISRLYSASRETGDRVYTHTFLHDGDLGPLLGALEIQQLRWPGMASNLAFELWKTTEGEYFVRVLYSGHVLKSAHGMLDWVPLSALNDRLAEYVPEDIIKSCS